MKNKVTVKKEVQKKYFVESKKTGGHFAFKTEKSNKPFENPMSFYLKIKLRETDIVADLGAYVGEYSLIAHKAGVKKIYAYEPTPQTFKLLKLNKKPNMEIFNKAVVGGDEKKVNLFISTGIGVTNSIKKEKGEKIKVDAIKYEDAIKDSTVVKIDVEGGEYSYNIIQPSLRAIILEFHPIVGRDWKKDAYKIIEQIESNGFKRIFMPNFNNGWSLTGCWEREL